MINKWILKAVIQKTISLLPGSNRINYLFQKHITKGIKLDDQYMHDKLTHAADHSNYFQKYAPDKPFRTLEIGTGWYPVVPLALYLKGAESVTTLDIYPYLTESRFKTTCTTFTRWHKEGKLEKILGKTDHSRLQKISNLADDDTSRSFDSLLAGFGITRIIANADRLPFEDATFLMVHTNNTLEHIESRQLSAILAECWRTIAAGGIMSHFIDMSDHFAHMDPSITIYNFLKFSEKAWKRIDNRIQPQNRLRIDDYRKICQGLNIPITKETSRPFDLSILNQVVLNDAFATKKPEDIAVSHSHIVCLKN